MDSEFIIKKLNSFSLNDINYYDFLECKETDNIQEIMIKKYKRPTIYKVIYKDSVDYYVIKHELIKSKS